MAKVDIFSGFLGAGKTTLIKKLIDEVYQGEKLVLIENEFGEIGIDGGFLQEAGIEITEMNSGCICCSLVGDFKEALQKVVKEMQPDRILIEPSGVGKLSDVIAACHGLDGVELDHFVTVVDVQKCRMYMKNFGEFFNNQIEYANTIILSRTQNVSKEKVDQCVAMLKEHNDQARILTTPWDELSGAVIKEAMDTVNLSIADELFQEEDHEHHHHDHDHECECGHEHHHHDHDHECEFGHEHHHHDHDHECECGHEHHHHDHDHECECGHEHHHHDHDHECECGHEHHHDHDHECGCGHHHHHHADEVFTTWGTQTAKVFSEDELNRILDQLNQADTYGTVLRAKGIVAGEDGWFYFDMVPEEKQIRKGKADYTGRLCVIGSQLNEEHLKELFLG